MTEGTSAEIRIGATAVAEMEVADSDLASALGLSDEPCFPAVFATSRMIALMELAGARILVPLMEPGQRSVGVAVDVRHTAATLAGQTVRAEAWLVGREGKLFVFEVAAFDPAGEIGRGRHHRAIVTDDRLLAGAARRAG